MNIPLTVGVILTKHPNTLTETYSGSREEYLFHKDENAEYNLGNKSIQCSRADSLKV